MSTKFSIIVPVYNSSNFLSNCLDSVISQTYKNYEIILINDGSTDNSPIICEEYAKKYQFIKYISKKNSGVSDTRNIGIEKATGDWVLFLDSDDTINKDTLKKICELIEAHPDVDYFFGNIFFDDTPFVSKIPNGCIKSKLQIIEGLINFNYANKKYHKKFDSLRAPAGKFYKLGLITKYNLHFPQSLKLFEDGVFNLYYTYYCKKPFFYKDPLYHHTTNKNSATHIQRLDQYSQSKTIITKIQSFLSETKIKTPSINYCAFIEFCHILNAESILPRKNALKIFSQYYDFSKDYLSNIEYGNLPIKHRFVLIMLKLKLFNILYFIYKLK